jgi:hypothetical protein
LQLLDTLELDHEMFFHRFGDLGVAFERQNEPEFFDLSNHSDVRSLGYHSFDGGGWLNYGNADGGLSLGLLIPAFIYGVEPILFAPEPAE